MDNTDVIHRVLENKPSLLELPLSGRSIILFYLYKVYTSKIQAKVTKYDRRILLQTPNHCITADHEGII